ncbi:MAG TPA: alpha/beta hydrolase-fold protein [Candidatus Kapabacteria bacterium]|nr:alpha/beta hydrolase-fold protein [Candidatus Kapabacteria bacterium]
MDRLLDSWYSPNLNKEMEIAIYGHSGFALLMFPSAAADYLEYERFYLIDAIKPLIEEGKIRVFSINSINSESWLNDTISPRQKAVRHQQFNAYVAEEVVPYMNNATGGRTLTITSGVSLGAFHAANTVFRRPDLFDGTIAMSGIYDLKSYSKGYYDEDVYFNSPMDYLPNLHDGAILGLLQSKSDIHFLSGEGSYEAPGATWAIANVLGAKGIPNNVEIWGPEWGHDWPTWRAMLPDYLSRYF